MQINLQLLLDFATSVVVYWGIAIVISDGLARIRNQGSFSWPSWLDGPARMINDILHFRPFYPGDSFPNYIPDEETDFYREFSRRLRKAKSEIYLSGDGFEMTKRAKDPGNQESADRADILDAAIIAAMNERRDLRFTRFQITAVCTINWISRLIYMKERFDARFRILINPAYDHIGLFCAIDPKKYRCVFEWQVLSGRHYLTGHKHKGFGFIYTNQAICQKLVSILDMIDENGQRDMSADDLRLLQKELWNKRVAQMRLETAANPRYMPLDPEMKVRFDKDPNAMEFRPNDFPPLPCDKN